MTRRPDATWLRATSQPTTNQDMRRKTEMGKAETTLEIPLEISDVSGQKAFSVANAPTANTVGELVHEMLGKMNLPRNDASGAPLTYQARLERVGRHLNPSERIEIGRAHVWTPV